MVRSWWSKVNGSRLPTLASPRRLRYRSIAQGIEDIRYIRAETAGLPAARAPARRREILEALAPKRALPEQALVGTAVNEAVRLSVEQGSRFVEFADGMHPRLA